MDKLNTETGEHSGGSLCSLIDDVARFMAYAYWRGRLESIPDGQNKEVAIEGFGNSDAPKWKASAKALLSMNGHISANKQISNQREMPKSCK